MQSIETWKMASVRALAAITAISSLAYAFSSEKSRKEKMMNNNPTISSGDSSSAGNVSSVNAKSNAAPNGASASAPTHAKKVVSAEEFNQQQDQAAMKKCLTALQVRQKAISAGKTPTNDADICPVELFRYLSCPYCAKVKGVLDFHNVPYRTVTADPLTSNHLPQTPWGIAPQIQFVTNSSAPIGSTARGPFVVDSDQIVRVLAEPLGFASQLEDEKTKETLKFISNAYSRGTFVAMYSNLNRAMEAYSHCVPDHYQYLPLKIAGSLGMSFISSRKAFPKIKEHFPMADGETIDSVLQRQTRYFIDRIPASKPFHGGDKPDIADVEMFAMSQAILNNKHCASIILKKEGGDAFTDWVKKMVPLMPNRSTANYGCEMPRVV